MIVAPELVEPAVPQREKRSGVLEGGGTGVASRALPFRALGWSGGRVEEVEVGAKIAIALEPGVDEEEDSFPVSD
jgi:hypothetical protein